jgi:hypothetical protein
VAIGAQRDERRRELDVTDFGCGYAVGSETKSKSRSRNARVQAVMPDAAGCISFTDSTDRPGNLIQTR